MQRVEKLERNGNDISKKESVESEKEVLPMISDTDKIVMKYGKPHKAVMIGIREFYEEIEWEQIPEPRYSLLKKETLSK
ncbi:hypothetical protein DN399_27950 (plasmid) [Bacillus sp. AR4-2]|nr:hypothetical protein [Bacillus sp. OA1]PEL89748.1 hypothetical protein CN626_17335 [Bacillus wiedmannii]QEL71869.1 hypothetical protein DN399_27950 [Bacillus sp. AR4-2]QEL77147.1 hypothetical protein DN405_27950 [Bacillus sp. SH8-8]TKI03338.1 hypothetical protein FC691_20430 [Bacillus cereus]